MITNLPISTGRYDVINWLLHNDQI